jgi:hypothetical protein
MTNLELAGASWVMKPPKKITAQNQTSKIIILAEKSFENA